MFLRAPLLFALCLLLGGCSIGAALLMPTGSPVMSKDSQPMFRHIIERERDRCRGGYYKGVDVKNLRDHVDKRWDTATHPSVPGKYYTFTYFDSTPAVGGGYYWQEYWYQLHDYDLDGKIDECKYYEVSKGKTGQNWEDKRGEENMKQFMKEADEQTRQGVYYRSHPDAL